MKSPPLFSYTGKLDHGQLPREATERLRHVLLSLDGKPVRVTVEEVKRRRSSNQNAYYWGVVVAMVTQLFRDAGNMVDAEDVHRFLKLRVGKLAQVVVLPDGEVVKSLGSTAKLSTQEFELYMERVRAWAAEHNCFIPLPNEAAAEEMMY